MFTIVLAGCGSHKKTVKYKHYSSKRHKEAVVVIPKEDIDAARQVFRKVKSKAVNARLITLNYIKNFAPLAIIEMKKYKIPASITLAQGILESGSGKSKLALKSNNHFGVKCHKNWKGAYVRHDDDKKNECFRKYSHPIGSFKDHSLFLTVRGRYSFLFKLKKDNYKAWARGLKKAGYATDPKYPKKLIKIVEDYQLYRYDEVVLHPKRAKRRRVEIEKTITVPKADTIVKVKTVSKLETYIVKKGDTLYAISKKLGVAVSDLKKWNNLSANAISIGQKLFVKKRNAQ
ncbi:MAG: glucosaminidase domain-containing protein [Flavobacteriaceae bacterium]|nr:glucosaminidase domain-containing protein [Flavobacteriaceae bacterium]